MSTPAHELDALLGDVPAARLPTLNPARSRRKPAAPASPTQNVLAPRGDVDPRLDAFVSDVMGEAARRTGYTYRLGEGSRTPEQQAEKVAGGFSRTYNSKHLSGRGRDVLAFDSSGNYLKDGQHPAYTALGDVYRERAAGAGLPVKWGGNFKGFYDPGHFELDGGGGAPAHDLDSLLGDVPTRNELDDLLSDVPATDPELRALEDEVGGPAVRVGAAQGVDPRRPAPLPQRQTFDPRTEEGRRGRDERAARERAPGAFLEVAAPLPPQDKLSDVAAGAEMVRAAYVRALAERGVPEPDAVKLVGSDYALRNATGAAVAPAAAITDDALDASARTLRVRLDASHVSELVDAYKAGRGTVGRVADWASDSTRSPGEKALDVAAPVVGAAGTVGGVVARPFQAASAGVFAATRGENPAREAYHTLTTGETRAAGSNPVGNYLRDSETLARINPRLGALLGGGADLVLDPTNLVGLGFIGKGAKALAGAGRVGRAAEEVRALGRAVGLLERGIVDARPLGLVDEAVALRAAIDASPAGRVAALEDRLARVTEAARKLRAGERLTPEEAALYAEARAKHAADVPEQFDAELVTPEGQRLLFSSTTGELRAAPRGATAQPHELDSLLGDVPRSEAPGAGMAISEDGLTRKAAELGRPVEDVRAEAVGQGYTVELPESASPAVRDEQLRYARERAEYHAAEAARATDAGQRANARALADEYAAEVARLEGGGGGTGGAPQNVLAPDAPAQSRPRRALGLAGDGADALKSNLYSADVSTPLRQALFPLMFETRATVKGLAEGLPSVMPRRHAQFVERVRSLPLAQEANDMGLALASINPAAKSEYFPSAAASRLPWVGASERVMEAQLDAVRLNVYDNLTRELRAAGLTPQSAPEEFRGVAHIVNVASGHGTLGRFTGAAAPVLNKALGSPKLLKSRFQVLNPVEYARLPPRARRIALRKLGRTAAAFTGLFGLAALVADEVGIDPRKPNFGTARFGETSYDLTGGEASKIRFIVNLVRSVGETARVATRGGSIAYEDTPPGVVGRFIRSQLSPAASLPVDAVTGKDYNGRDFTWTEGTIRRVVPLIAQDLYDGFAQGGGVRGALKALPAFVGVGVRQLDPERVKRDWQRANNRPVPVELSDPARKELERVGVNLKKLRADVVRPGYKVEGVDGEAVAPMRKEDETGLAQVSADDIARDLAAEVSAAVEDVVNSPDYASFETDSARAQYLSRVVRHARARVYAGLRLKAREGQLEDLKRVEEYQRRLEGRSQQVKPGETLKLGSDVTSNRLANFGGVRESVNVEDRRLDTPRALADEVDRAGAPEIDDSQARQLASFLDSLEDYQGERFGQSLDEAVRMGVIGEGAAGAGEVLALGAQGTLGGDFSVTPRALRLLAREKRLRPAQFRRDALSGRYGELMRAEVKEGIVYPQNNPPAGPYGGSPAGREWSLPAPARDEIRRAVDEAKPDAEPTFREFPAGVSESRMPRSSMPQVKGEHRGAMVNFLRGRGIAHTRETIPAGSLKPSQAEYSPEKVAKARTFKGADRALLVSSDSYVADGHHQWLSKLHEGEDTPVEVIRLDAPIGTLLIEMARFPSSGVDGASAGARPAASLPGEGRPPLRREELRQMAVDAGLPLAEVVAQAREQGYQIEAA